MRPFALKFRRGIGYLGVVCDASISLDSTDLMSYVYTFDPLKIGAGLSKVFEMEMDYLREYKGNFGSGTSFQELARLNCGR